MADKNIQIKDLKGNLLFPKTKGSLVFNDKNEALGTVEAGAQVNKIEKIKLNGVELSVVSKEVNIDIQSAEYTIVKSKAPETGYSATYQLMKDNVAVGEKINIPKDMVVQSGSVKEVTEPDQPVAGYSVGDKYIDLVLANAELSHIYILVNDLVDIYTAGAGITITNRAINVDTEALKATFATGEQLTQAVENLNQAIENKASLPAQASHAGKFLTTDGTNASWANVTSLQNANGNNSQIRLWVGSKAEYDALTVKEEDVLYYVQKEGEAVDIYELLGQKQDKLTAGTGITIADNVISADVNAISAGLEGTYAKIGDAYTKAEADNKFAEKATTLAGYGIQDAYTKTEVDSKVDVKADKATTLAGYGITDAYTKGEVDTLLSNLITYEELV